MVLELRAGALDGITGPAGSRDHPGGKGPLWNGITGPAGSRDHPGGKGPLWNGISGMVCYPAEFLEGIPK
jgi:hypothetical protein